jgi:hypothetical protein
MWGARAFRASAESVHVTFWSPAWHSASQIAGFRAGVASGHRDLSWQVGMRNRFEIFTSECNGASKLADAVDISPFLPPEWLIPGGTGEGSAGNRKIWRCGPPQLTIPWLVRYIPPFEKIKREEIKRDSSELRNQTGIAPRKLARELKRDGSELNG